ncbi:sensor histidine kinase [Tahibacter soli]|uniref:histidine kinase n=1 Tax=Tahibacter soli TaxID=2983605 RepID=A0A9X3YMU0_9GAMM|nr:HAMP domain-containing sensor histidine kinase [Tahibacter soli]MDC8014584.1 HAMP domain-containing sensor histidine kinase [Tahibacter soli]
MNSRTPVIGGRRSVQRWISAALIVFGVVMVASLTLQAFSSQRLLEHGYWTELLESVSADHAARVRRGEAASLPAVGIVRSWYVENGRNPSNAPDYFAALPLGHYSSEGWGDIVETDDSFHALVVDLPPGRLVTIVDIGELEDQQNLDSLLSGIWALLLIALIAGVIAWLHVNFVRPVRDLAERMRNIDPGTPGARLPTTYGREEIAVIAQASNAHLERVERFIERERSLLDQASHEFRTPIAVIAGAVDVLKQIALPDASKPALGRIEHAVEDLSETMVALLYLAREASPDGEPVDVTVLHELLPRLARDHEHLVRDKPARLRVGDVEPTFVAAPEAMVRIAVSNLIRNAIENTAAGHVELTLAGGVVCVADSGSGFDPVEAARRYRDSLRSSAPVRGQGLGLFLIGRICDRFGWKLAIEPAAAGGTRATLDVSASVFVP